MISTAFLTMMVTHCGLVLLVAIVGVLIGLRRKDPQVIRKTARLTFWIALVGFVVLVLVYPLHS